MLLALEALERQFMDAVLIEELNYFVELSDKDSTFIYQKSKNREIYKVENNNTPQNMAFLSNYPVGTYDLEYKGQMHDLGVIKRDNYYYYILYNDANFEHLEHNIIIYLVAGCFVILLLTTWYGLSLSNKVLGPIISLASNVKALDPENSSNYLAPNYADDEVGILALEFDAFHDRLQSLIQREHEFTGNASHELRTPLSVIIAASENLSLQRDLPDHLQQKVSRIRRSADEMSARLNVLLALSRKREESEAHTLKTYLCPVIKQLIIDYRELLAAEVKVISDLQPSPWVKAPNAIVAMLMGNLIKNAFIFTKTGSITIKLKNDCFTVTDTGCGIASKDIDRVSDRGFRGQNSQGSGFGLDISKRICDHYGWYLDIESQINHGTTVKWTFSN
jgi:signal transduction histidine kinase